MIAAPPPDTPSPACYPEAMRATYEMIGVDYSNLRKPDRRIARIIAEALGPAETILNVGAGAGSYEPLGKTVTAIEPSLE